MMRSSAGQYSAISRAIGWLGVAAEARPKVSRKPLRRPADLSTIDVPQCRASTPWSVRPLESEWMADQSRAFRTGLGHDIHRLVPGKPMVLGGVDIPADVGFDTHSDGDVLCHALVDALAGAIADGDLGTHFPEDDPEAQDARSLGFLEQFAVHIAEQGYEVANVDCFVVLGTVRLRPHIESMRTNVAAALKIELERVSVKARSNDGIGAEGEGTACAAWANVLVYPSMA